MCEFFSGVITKGGKVLTDNSHSHSTILAKYGIIDDKVHRDFLFFEIKRKKGVDDEFAEPTKEKWELLFESVRGNNVFQIPEWYKQSYDKKIWTVFIKEQNKRIEENKAAIEERKKAEEMKSMGDFTITLADCSYLKEPIRILKELCSEMPITFDKEKLELIGMDPANVCMTKYTLLSSACVEWDVKKPFRRVIHLENFYTILKNAKKSDLVQLKKKGEGSISIIFRGESERGYEFPLAEVEEKIVKKPNLQFSSHVKMPSRLFAKQMREIATIGESVSFLVNKSTFFLKAENDFSKLSIMNKEGEDISIKTSQEQKVKYSVEYLMMMIEPKYFDEMDLHFKKDYPLNLAYILEDRLSLEFILVPRIENG